ncbi:DNA polymerase III subunit gamma/tau [Planktothrix agardhii]|uniref:DNA polymerase III subunit gamma/tau n=1 Tax=Planktothrix agardhii TaxID=1160 RepID=UPI00040E4139|nr:DNA polymerase III subunit gamma/tau [Planktothrix agardhii]
MSYEPLHHKYRPQTFAHLVGQEAIATTLTNAIESQRIAPAYLFTGPRGTGKTSSARILAKSLNCLANSTPTATPCGVCEVCKGITNGSTLDVIEIDAASNTGVDNIRELIERSQFAPVQCRYKVYVIDECHMLSTAAFNALLKTLEEPPDRVVFVLATTDPQRVLPTIISRCQRFDFRRIPLDSMIKHLKYIAQQEAINIADDAVFMVAQIAQGGLRDAESLLDQLSLLSGEITVEKVWDLVGAVPERDLISLLEAIDSGDTAIILDCIRNLLNRGREPLIVLQNLAGFYRDLLIAKTASTRSDLVALTQPTWEQLCQFSHRWDSTIILAGQKHLRESEVQIKHSTQPRLWLEIILLGLLPAALQKSVITQTVTVTQTPQRTVQTQPETVPFVQRSEPSNPSQNPVNSPVFQPTYTPEPQPQTQPQVKAEIPAPPTEPPIVTDANLDQIWQQVLDYIQPNGTQQMFRQQGRLIQFNSEVAVIKMASSTLLKMAQTKQKLSSLEKAFQQVFGHPVKINFDSRGGNSVNQIQDITPPSPPYSPVNNSRVSSPEVVQPPVINTQEQQQISESPNQDINKQNQIETINNHSFKPIEKVETVPISPEQADTKAVAIASQKLVDFFQGKMVELEEKPTSKTATLLDKKADFIEINENENFIEIDDHDEDNYDDF